MKRIQLNRQNHLEPQIMELNKMVSELRDFLGEDIASDCEDWKQNYKDVISFQNEDGSFSLLDSFRIEGDVRVDYCYTPTYLCSAIMMKAIMFGAVKEEDCREALTKALKVCCGRDLKGHGYEAFLGEYDALSIFMEAGVREFILYYGDIYPEFSEMIRMKRMKFRNMIINRDFEDIWSSGFEQKVRQLDRYLSNCNVFVYGILLRGERNHSCISGCEFLGNGEVAGFSMYDIGSFPGIVPDNDTILGELYEVDDDTLLYLDHFEGEGSLYIRKYIPAKLESGELTLAHVYVYNGTTDGLEKIPYWLQPYTGNWEKKKDNYVWYVAYGSNMNYERFMHYIKGGSFKGGGACHEACSDLTEPRAIINYDIPYNMYFRNTSGSWDNKGVAFLDLSKEGYALGVAYLVTREQFRHISCQENNGTPPELSINWYNVTPSLGYYAGYEVFTISNKRTEKFNEPSEAYLDTIKEGILSNYPEMSEMQIESYFEKCKNNR